MRAICVDDETLILNMIVTLCRDLPQLSEVQGFSDAEEALRWVQDNPIDIALLDIDMPKLNGINLARKLKNICPDAAVIFLTGYSDYAYQAFGVRASGYLLKPINRDKLEKEVDFAISRKKKSPERTAHISVRTFGEFDVFVDGKVVNFKRAKSKELLAYLIDRNGGGVSRATAFSILWEDEIYDRNRQKHVDVIVRSLRETLKDYGISEILSIDKGLLRILPEKIDCDLYRFIDGDIEIINSYRGEYMNQYSWAGATEGFITTHLKE